MRIRYSIVILAGLIGAVILLVTQFFGDSATHQSTASDLQPVSPDTIQDLNRPHAQTGQNQIQLQGRIKKYYYDWKNKRGQLIQVEGDSVEPLQEVGLVEVVKPQARIHVNDKQVLVIKGEKGHIKSSGNHPKSGRFFGKVTVALMANVKDDAKQLKTSSAIMLGLLKDGATFDIELGRLTSSSELFVTSRYLELKGQGLELQYNEKLQRIQRLIIAKGESIKLNLPENYTQTTSRNVNDKAQATQALEAPAQDPGATIRDTQPEHYQLTFENKIAISHKLGWASGEQLSALFDASQWMKESSGSRHKTSTAATTNQPAFKKTDAQVYKRTSLFQANPSTVAIIWKGAMRLNAYPGRITLKSPKDWIMSLAGTPVLAGDKQGRSLKASTVDLKGDDQNIAILGSAIDPVEINLPKLGKLTAEEVIFNNKNRQGAVYGPGTLERSQQHLASHKAKKSRKTDNKSELSGMISWKKALQWRMSEVTPVTQARNTFSNLVITSALFQGPITVQHERASMHCQQMQLIFHEHKKQATLKSILAAGDIKARSSKLVDGQSELAIDAQSLTASFYVDPKDQTQLERLYATNQATDLTDAEGSTLKRDPAEHLRVYARRPGEYILSDQLEMYLTSPGHHPPLRHPASAKNVSNDAHWQFHPKGIWPPEDRTTTPLLVSRVRASGHINARMDKYDIKLSGEELFTTLRPSRSLTLIGGEMPGIIERKNMLLAASKLHLDEQTATVNIPGRGLFAFDDARQYVHDILTHAMQFSDSTGEQTFELEKQLHRFRLLEQASLDRLIHKKTEKAPAYKQGGWLRWRDGMTYIDQYQKASFAGAVAGQILELTNDLEESFSANMTDRRMISDHVTVLLQERSEIPKRPGKNVNQKKQAFTIRPRQLAVHQLNASGKTELENEIFADTHRKKLLQRLRLTGTSMQCDIPRMYINIASPGRLLIQDHTAVKTNAKSQQAPRFSGKGNTLLNWQSSMQLDGKALSVQLNEGVHIIHDEKPEVSDTERKQLEITSHVFYADFANRQKPTQKNISSIHTFASKDIELNTIIARGSPDGTIPIIMTNGEYDIQADNLIYDHDRQGAVLRSQANPYLSITHQKKKASLAKRVIWDLLTGQIHILELGPTLLTNGQ